MSSKSVSCVQLSSFTVWILLFGIEQSYHCWIVLLRRVGWLIIHVNSGFMRFKTHKSWVLRWWSWWWYNDNATITRNWTVLRSMRKWYEWQPSNNGDVRIAVAKRIARSIRWNNDENHFVVSHRTSYNLLCSAQSILLRTKTTKTNIRAADRVHAVRCFSGNRITTASSHSPFIRFVFTGAHTNEIN